MAKLELPYEQVFDLTHKMCTRISPDVLYLLTEAAKKETNPAAKTFLETMVENERLAGIEDKPVCQSPGYPSVWIRWGEAYEPNLSNLIDNITRSVVDATKQGYIRPSIVHPLTRFNPGDSTGRGVPNYELRYEKDLPYCEIIVSAKGCGAELPNVAKILTPATLGKDFKGLKSWCLTRSPAPAARWAPTATPARRSRLVSVSAARWTSRRSSLAKPSRPATGLTTTRIRFLMNSSRSCSLTSISSETAPRASAATRRRLP